MLFFSLILIIIVISSIIILYLLFFFIWKIKKLNGIKIKRNVQEKPSFIDNKFFVASDGYRLEINSNFLTNKKNNKNIIYIFIHDIFFYNKAINDKIKKINDKNFLIITQRGYESKEKNIYKSFPKTLIDYKEIIKTLKEKYNNKICLVSEGFGQVYLFYLSKLVNQSIIINPILDFKKISFTFFERFFLKFPYITYLKKDLNLKINPSILNIHNNIDINKKGIIIYNKFLYIYHLILNTKRIYHNQIKNLKVIQSKNDLFYNEILFINRLNDIKDIKILNLKTHLLSGEKMFFNFLEFNN